MQPALPDLARRLAAPLLLLTLMTGPARSATAPPPAPPAPTPSFSPSMPCVPRLSTDHITITGASGVYRRDVVSLSVAADRTRVSAGGGDGVLQVRNTVSGVDFCVANANLLAMSQDGHYGVGIALNPTWKDWKVDGGAAIVLWDLTTGAEARRLVAPLPRALVLGVSNTGAVAFAGEGTPLQLWDNADPKPIAAVTTSVRQLGFTADGKTLVVAGDGGLDLVVLATGKVSAHLAALSPPPPAAPAAGATPPATPPAPVVTSSAALSVGKKLIAVAGVRGTDGVIEVWDPTTKKAKLSLQPPIAEAKGKPKLLALSPDDKVLALAFDGTPAVLRYDLVTGKALPSLPFATVPSGLTFSGDGEWLVAATSDGLLGAWDKAGVVIGYPPVSVIVPDKPIDQVGDRVLFGEKDSVRLMVGSEQKWSANFERPPWDAVRLSPKGTYAWTGGDKGTVVYDAESGRELWRLSDYGHSFDARFSSDEEEILISSLKGVVVVKSKNARPVRTLVGGGGTAPVALSPDDKRAAGITSEHFVTVWSLLTGRPQGQSNLGETVRPTGVAFSGDGKYVLTAELSTDQVGSSIRLWNGEDATAVDALSFAPLKVDPYRVGRNAQGQLEVTTRQGNIVLVETK